MPRFLAITATLAAVTAAVLAAPGMSARPYVPEAVEFELAAPKAPPRAAAAGTGFVAPPVRTARRFNLVGLSWRGQAEPAIALRARTDGGEWTRWTPATRHGEHGPEASGDTRATSEPVWVGEADWVQYRMSRRVAGLRLHFVNTTGTATAADRLLTGLRSAANAAVLRLAPAWGANGPRIHSRREWGAGQCPSRGVAYGGVRAAVVHHTVSANDYSKEQVPAAMLAICRFHRNTNGWADIGYNFVVDRFGRIWEGRAGGIDEAVIGAHAQGYNAQTTGISNLGTFEDRPQSDAAIAAMARLIRWKLGVHGVRTYGKARLTSAGGDAARYPKGSTRAFNRISGHRDTGYTACPGLQLYRQLPELRERVGERRPPGRPIRVDAPLPDAITYDPGGVRLGGSVTDRAGQPVAGAEFELQRLGRLGWRTLATATSGRDGGFAVRRKIKRRPVLRWKFAGTAQHRPYRGDGVAVGIAPLLDLQASAARVAPREPVRLTGTIAPARTRAKPALLVERSQDGRWRRGRSRELTVERGRFAATRRFAKPGLYRVTAVFPGDKANAASASEPVEIMVEEPGVILG